MGAGLAPRDWPPLGEEEPLGARRVCLRRGGGPLGDAGNSPRAHSLRLRRPRWQPHGGGRKRTSLSVFMKEAPGPHCLSGIGVDVCPGVGGAQITPLQARPSFSSAGVSLCKIGPSEPQFPLL